MTTTTTTTTPESIKAFINTATSIAQLDKYSTRIHTLCKDGTLTTKEAEQMQSLIDRNNIRVLKERDLLTPITDYPVVKYLKQFHLFMDYHDTHSIKDYTRYINKLKAAGLTYSNQYSTAPSPSEFPSLPGWSIPELATKKFNQAVNDYKAKKMQTKGNDFIHPKHKAKLLAKAKAEAINDATRNRIRKSNNKIFIFILNLEDHLTFKDNQDSFSNGKVSKPHHQYQYLIKECMRYPGRTIIIKDRHTGARILHTTGETYKYQGELDAAFNTLLIELQVHIITETYNTSPEVTDPLELDYMQHMQETYEDIPTNTFYKAVEQGQDNYYKKNRSDRYYAFNTNYINTFNMLTEDNLAYVKYLEENHLLKERLLTEKQIAKYEALAQRHLELAEELYCINKYDYDAIRHFESYEYLTSKLMEDADKREQQLSYEAMEYMVHEDSQQQSNSKPQRSFTVDYTQLDYKQTPQDPELYEQFYYSQSHTITKDPSAPIYADTNIISKRAHYCKLITQTDIFQTDI